MTQQIFRWFRKTDKGMYRSFLIGNGLGMAIDPSYFSLSSAVEKVWESEELGIDTKDRITALCPNNSPPFTEDALEKLQRVIWSCSNLKENENHIKWLEKDARNFPDAFNRFKHLVAKHFFEFPLDKKEAHIKFSIFVQKLINEIEKSPIHIFTLNYDSLLYNEFVQNENVFNGYNGKLIDGLTDSGFSRENLTRKPNKNFGYYLHLHGTPIVYDEPDNGLGKWDKNVHKIKFKEEKKKWDLSEKVSNHLVLTHEKFKSDIIQTSELLNAYWHYFERSLEETNCLVLYGYSGNDPHINTSIKKFLPTRSKITIVQWEASNNKKDKWEEILERKVILKEMPNILTWDLSG